MTGPLINLRTLTEGFLEVGRSTSDWFRSEIDIISNKPVGKTQTLTNFVLGHQQEPYFVFNKFGFTKFKTRNKQTEV